jgi:hypothetical protein
VPRVVLHRLWERTWHKKRMAHCKSTPTSKVDLV